MEFSSLRGVPDYNNLGNVLYGFELKNGTGIDDETLSDNPAELGIVTGLLTTACIFNLKVTVLKEDFFKEPLHRDYLKLKVMLHFALKLVCFCILSPFVFLSLVLLCAYRCAIRIALKIQCGRKFSGLLNGTDSVWAVEDASCKSVINVFATVEAGPHSSNEDFLLKLRKLAKEKLLGPDIRLGKLSCIRKKKYGYFYWEKCDNLDITEHVRWLESIDDENPHDERLNEESFNKIFSKVCTKPLPQDDQASWEILVGKNQLGENLDCYRDMEEGLIFSGGPHIGRKNIGIPIIFRVHHTIGDGIALFQLLLATIADSKDSEMEFQEKGTEIYPAIVPMDNTKKVNCTRVKPSPSNTELMLRNNRDLLGASMPFSLIINVSLKEIIEKYVTARLRKFVSLNEVGQRILEFGVKNVRETIEYLAHLAFLKLKQIAKLISVLIGMPGCLVHQAVRSMDNSALHGPKLSGEKITSFWIEGNSGKNIGDINLLTKIQQVKNATGTRFGDVILAALSASLHKYFKKIGEFAPKSLTVVLPTRMSISDEKLRLNNGFTVGLLPLCISGTTEAQTEYMAESRKDPTIMQRLFDVARNSHCLRGQYDYLINFWVMKWLSALLPETLLRPILNSHSTLVFSNIPGPKEVHILSRKLRNIVFLVPHRGTTGIGFSLLSYGGNIHFGLLVDKALIRNENLLAGILENTVREIDNLHEVIFMSPFSKSLHNLPTASTNTESESCE